MSKLLRLLSPLLSRKWQSLKMMVDLSRMENLLRLAVAVVVFVVLIVRHEYRAIQLQTSQEETGQNVDTLRAQVAALKKTITLEDKQRDEKIAELDQNVLILLQRSAERAKQVRQLKDDIRLLRISEAKAMRRIDTLNSDEITDFFKNLQR